MVTAEEQSAGGDPWQEVRQHVLLEAARRLKDLGVTPTPEDLDRELSPPPSGLGDLALPLFRYAKKAATTPEKLAEALAVDFPKGTALADVSPTRGFLNFTAGVPWLAEATLGRILSLKEGYARAPPTRGTVCVEHTSANPTGQLHVGRSRNSVIGDTYARVLSAAGYTVRVHFYVDDVGRQAATLVWIWSKPVAEWPSEVREKSGISPGTSRPEGMKPDTWRGKPYPSASEIVKKDAAALQEVTQLTARLERGEIPPQEYRQIPQEILTGVVASLERMGVHFDDFVWESDFILNGSVATAIEKLSKTPHATQEEGGATAVDASSYGLPKDLSKILLTRSDGSHLYIARDVAYHLEKLSHFDRVVDVIGEDHKMHFRALLALLAELGLTKKPEVLHYAFIGLPEGKMSTRAGRIVNLDDLLDEARDLARAEVVKRRQDLTPEETEKIAESVGTGAVRFHLLAIQPDKPIVFKWDEALSFEGKSGPFVQYSHARASSLLRKAEEEGHGALLAGLASGSTKYLPLPGTPDEREVELLKTLSRLPALVRRVSQDGSVHLLPLYAHEVSERLNGFYQAVRVLGGAPEWLPFRLALVAASRQVLKNTSGLIGIEPLERM